MTDTLDATATVSTLQLRDYQLTDVERLRDEFRKGARAPIYQLATGGGKTVVFSHIIQAAAMRGRRTGVFVHRRELIKQTSNKLDWTGTAHGIMAAGLDRDHDALVQVLSIQSAVNRKLPDFDFIVIDEAHHARAETWHKLLASQTKARLLGVTATPARTDGKGLGVKWGGLFDSMVCGPSMQELVDAGHLAPSKCFVPARLIDTRGLKKVAGDYRLDELAARASVVTGDAIREYRDKALGRTAIAFCVNVEHAQNVASAFSAAGFRAACVHGKTPKDERDRLIAGLGDGSLDILTSCELISEGLDVPAVGAVILLRPTHSLIMALQQIGRGMRPAPGKDCLVVLDHAGNTVKHGLPEEDRDWSLDGVEKRGGGGFHEPDPDAERDGPTGPVFIDGELVAAAPDPLARWKRMGYYEFIRHPRSESDARSFAMAKGYKPGWAWHFMQEQRMKARAA